MANKTTIMSRRNNMIMHVACHFPDGTSNTIGEADRASGTNFRLARRWARPRAQSPSCPTLSSSSGAISASPEPNAELVLHLAGPLSRMLLAWMLRRHLTPSASW